MARHVYLDWNASAPPHPEVLAAMRAAAEEGWANPASVHGPGRRARAFIEEAREAVAALVGMDARDVVLTSGGTEANNLALALPFGEVAAGATAALRAGEGAAAATATAPRSDEAARADDPALPLEWGKGAPPSDGVSPKKEKRKRGATPAKSPPERRAPVASLRPPALLVSRIEHPSVVRAAEELARRGVRVEWIAPEPSGVVTAAAFAEALARLGPEHEVKLFVLQAVNHETGVVQPVAEVAALAHGHGALLHVDAVQAVGRLAPSAWAGADIVSVAAHKIRGPKGIGALCVRAGLKVRPLLFGGAQERGVRPGTQDPVAAAGFAVAARRAREGGAERYAAVAELRDRLEGELLRLGVAGGAVANGEGATQGSGGERGAAERSCAPAGSAVANGGGPRAPHVINLSWPGWRGAELCAALDLEGVAVSSGSACSAGTAEPSPVLTAMVGAERAGSAVRISLGEDTKPGDVEAAVEAFRRVLRRG